MKNIIMTITGPTASGKTTLERILVGNGTFARAVSTTTREMREGEEDTVDYHYIHYNDFMRLLDQGQMIESVVFANKCYGLQAKHVKECFAKGKPVVVVVEPEGMKQIAHYAKENNLHHIAVFVTNTLGELIERFISRDPMMDADVRLSRIDNLITNEMNWEKMTDWDVVVECFDEGSEDNVVNFLTNMVERIELSKVS